MGVDFHGRILRLDKNLHPVILIDMIRLDGRSQFFLLDTVSECYTRHDSTDTIMRQLVSRRRTEHLLVVVAKGAKSLLLPVEKDLLDFNKKLQETMANL